MAENGRLLITHSLLSSWSYMFSCYEGQEDNALEEFVQTLHRIPTVQTEAMLNGIEFENEVYKVAAGNVMREPHKSWERGIQAVATVLKGASVQIRLQQEVTVGKYTFLLYGILDGLKAGVIYDVKFSKSYDVGKYLDNTQHPVYFRIVPEADTFSYLVSDGNYLFVETYRRKDTRLIEDIIAEFMTSIEKMGLLPVYLEKWAAK